MNPTTHFAFADFARALENFENTFRNETDRYLLLTGKTGVGKTMLCRQLHTALDRCRYRVLYFSHARHLNATGLIRVLTGCFRLPTMSRPKTLHRPGVLGSVVRKLPLQTPDRLHFREKISALHRQTRTTKT
jgi:predicted ATPase